MAVSDQVEAAAGSPQGTLGAAAGASGPSVPPRSTADTISLWLFVALVAAALPLLVFHFGAYRWFSRAEWQLLGHRTDSGFPEVFKPHGGAHWVAVPRLIFVGLWQLVGVTSYRPYQLVVVVMHLAVAVMLRVVMRRAGVRPVLASAAAAVFVLCGPGASNSVWAFQVAFIGSMVWGLGQLLLADHDGPMGRRDLAALGFGMLAITSSGVGVTTTAVVGLAVLLRRGWRPALLQTVPIALAYWVWLVTTEGTTSGPTGGSSPGVLGDWFRESVVGTFVGLGHFTALAWLLGAVLVGGLVVGRRSQPIAAARPERARLAAPIALAAGAAFFAVSTGTGRALLVVGEGARADRYVYLQAAFVLPLLAVAAEAIAKRWRALVPVIVAVFLLPIPFNIADGIHKGVGPDFNTERRILTTAVRMPFARDVPRNVEPMPDAWTQHLVTMGLLLDAEASGRLDASTFPLTPEVVDEYRVRLGVAQRSVPGVPHECRRVAVPMDIEPDVGDRLYLGSLVAIAIQDGGRPTSPPVVFRTGLNGSELTIELPDLHLQLTHPRGDATIALCEPPSG